MHSQLTPTPPMHPGAASIGQTSIGGFARMPLRRATTPWRLSPRHRMGAGTAALRACVATLILVIATLAGSITLAMTGGFLIFAMFAFLLALPILVLAARSASQSAEQANWRG